MLPFALPIENSSAKKGSACAQLMREAAGGARRSCGASSVKKNHDTLVVCRMQKCVCAVQCVVHVSCGEQFTRHMLGVDAGRAVGSPSLCSAASVPVAAACNGAARAAMARMLFCRGRRTTCTIIGSPPSTGIRALPGNRVEPKRAGITAKTRMMDATRPHSKDVHGLTRGLSQTRPWARLVNKGRPLTTAPTCTMTVHLLLRSLQLH